MISVPIIIAISILLAAGTGAVVYTYTTQTPDNKAPVISVSPIVNATADETIFINATVTDDGTITTAVWDQVSGPKSNFSQVAEDLYVTTDTNGSYLFQLEVQDDKQAISAAGVLINVKSVEPVPRECTGPNEVWSDEQQDCICKDGYHQDGTEACVPNPPPKPTCTVDQAYNPVTNKCDPKPAPPKDIKAVVVGDVYDGTSGKAVFEQVKKQNADYIFVLGDWYGKTSWLKSSYGSLGDKMWCVIGNHEASNEDGSAEIEKLSLAFCGNSYWLKYYGNLFLLFNTNDNQNTLTTGSGKVFSNTTIMNGVKNVFIMGHKGCATPPNSHHPAGEIKTLCDYIKSKIPSTIKTWYISAHNHVYSESKDKTYIQSGAGGRSHYTCGTNAEFPFCDNSHYGFVSITIKADGTVTSSFIDSGGKIIH